MAKLEEINCSVNELNIEESFENKFKILVIELDKSNSQLRTFSSRSKKLDKILGQNKSARNRGCLCYKEIGSHVIASSKTIYVLASTKTKKVKVSESKSKDTLGRYS